MLFALLALMWLPPSVVDARDPPQPIVLDPIEAEPLEVEPIEVIGITPTHGTGLPKTKVPANVQSATSEDLQRAQSLDLSEFLNQSLGSVHVNEAQSNPLQPDVQYRGFTASPLLGLPQGLAVYQDGVRVNEPFGDTVNWALLPQSAIAGINLLPGSNPLFGLNALGGALSIQTKNGFTHSGSRGELSYGSFDRKFVQAETGGIRNALQYFVTGEYFDEGGWRDFSPSEAKRVFGNIGWQGGLSTLNLSITAADTDLIGNGPAPEQLLAIDREAPFTRPDITENELLMLNLRGSRQLGAVAVLDGNVYFRDSDISTLNGDDSDFGACEAPANVGLLCEEEVRGEEVVEDQNGDPVAFRPAVEGATVNTSSTDQEGYGGTVQVTLLDQLFSRENQLIVGSALDLGQADFGSQTELGTLDATRQAVGSGVLAGDSFVNVETDVRNYGLYLTDTWSATDALALTLSGRYNRTEIELEDQLGADLNGDHTFQRFNPAVGATYQFAPQFSVYAGYNEANRAPTPVELTCADRNDPCRLPNAFLADPPLDDVVAKTIEAGMRGNWRGVDYNFGVFNTVNEGDIIFISAGTVLNQGFFDNVGDTRRRGVELNLVGRLWGSVAWSLDYTYLKAEFRDSLTIASANHPLADVNNEIQVEPGDRIPGVPRHLLKAGLSYAPLPKIRVGADVLYNADQVLRGDESNQLEPVDDYALVNLRAQYRVNKRAAVFGSIDNVFDADYETFGVLGEAAEVLGDQFASPQFLSPGAPRGLWVGLRVSF
jgi:outer membrane receptor protein involved in Fe transport